jgi:hypothetical protein
MHVSMKRLCLLLGISLLVSCGSLGGSFSDPGGTRSQEARSDSTASIGPTKGGQTAHAASETTRDMIPAAWKIETFDTTADADYMTEGE